MAVSGCSLTTIALVKPAASNASFQRNTPSRMAGRNSVGVVFSIHHVIGSTGSDNGADGFFLTRFQRCTWSRQGVTLVEVWSVTSLVKKPTRGSAYRTW